MVKYNVLANDRLRISITDLCNLNCYYCTNEGQFHNGGNFLQIRNIEKILEKLALENVFIRKINITGGEPTLHPNLSQIIKLCSEICDSVTLNTNGLLLNKESVFHFHEIGLRNIKFGVDSFFNICTKPNSKNNIRKIDEIIDLIFYSIDLMPRTSINIVLSDFNIEEFERTINFIIQNNIDKVEFLELINHDFRNNNSNEYQKQKIDGIIKKYIKYFSSISYNPTLAKYICTTENGLLIQFAEDFCNRRVCQNLWTRINSSGRLLPCIKDRQGREIDLTSSIIPQIIHSNILMCNGPQGHVPRDSYGKLLSKHVSGKYKNPNCNKIINSEITELDP